jgi:hypothetical protein
MYQEPTGQQVVYDTNKTIPVLCLSVSCSFHYMFRLARVIIIRWFILQKALQALNCYTT